MLLQELGLHLGQRDVAVGVDQPLQIRSMRIELGTLRLTLSPRLALPGFSRPAHPDDGRCYPDPEPRRRMTGWQPSLRRGDHTFTQILAVGALHIGLHRQTMKESHCSSHLGIPPESENREPALGFIVGLSASLRSALFWFRIRGTPAAHVVG